MTNVDPIGIPAEQGVGGPVLLLSDFDRLGRIWGAWAVVDDQGVIVGAFTDCEGAIQYEGGSIAQARAIVTAHCR